MVTGWVGGNVTFLAHERLKAHVVSIIISGHSYHAALQKMDYVPLGTSSHVIAIWMLAIERAQCGSNESSHFVLCYMSNHLNSTTLFFCHNLSYYVTIFLIDNILS